MNPYSISSRALNTSAGMMVFFPDETVCSFALLFLGGSSVNHPGQIVKWRPAGARQGRPGEEKKGGTYALAKWLIKTVALLVMARIAFACICVFEGNMPLARRVMIDFGSVRSSMVIASLSRSRSFSRSRSLSFSDCPPPPPRLDSDGDVGPAPVPAADPVVDIARTDWAAAAEGAGVVCLSEAVVVGTGGRDSESRSMAAAARAEAGLTEGIGSPVAAIVVSSSATTKRATETSLRRVPSLFFGGMVIWWRSGVVEWRGTSVVEFGLSCSQRLVVAGFP